MKRCRLTAASSTAPPGGWGLTYIPPDHSRQFPAQGFSPEMVVDAILKWRRNNSLPPNENDVWEFCNNKWCSRAPSRCPDWTPEESAPVVKARKILRPIDYGSWIWQYLNTFGVVFDKARFLSAIDQAVAMLAPNGEMGQGCSICFDHFAGARKAYPPDRVNSRQDAAVWVWTVHNLANDYAEHPRQSFHRIAAAFGWEPMETESVVSIQSKLKA